MIGFYKQKGYIIVLPIPISSCFSFFLTVLPKFIKFNKLYQSKSLNLHLLHNNIQLLYKELLSCYIQSTYIRANNLCDVDPGSESSMLPLNEMYLGVAVSQKLIKPSILANKPLVENVFLGVVIFT